ncbi:MAG: DNA gyrase subunit A [Methylobacteriaceae bacterium]|nr:DNA gyrase subunit A [Methylobacteriaceae bacterium]
MSTMDRDGRIELRELEHEMRSSYLDYAMSVIVGRALPDVRDGLKPVHRRVLYTMDDMGLAPERGHVKSANIVGRVMGEFHPHGDQAIYDALARLAQDFASRYPLIDGQGNFGTPEFPPAAMRYTEAKMSRIAVELLRGIDEDTVDMVPTYDDRRTEPVVLPARLPNLLINGSSGIAVGMATNIPPHNLGEVVDAVVAYIDAPESTVDELMMYVKGPDFPTGGVIVGRQGIVDAYRTGRGRVVVRGRAHNEQLRNGRNAIIFTELPYQVNKSDLVRRIAELARDKVLPEVTDANDESGRDGTRVVITLRRGAVPLVVLNKLYKHTSVQSTFGVNAVALVDNVPRTLGLRDIIHHYLEHQKQVVVRRSRFRLGRAEARAHILEGLLIALGRIDEVIALIRAAADPDEAREGLMDRFGLTEVQARAILDLRLQRLTALGREEISEALNKLAAEIAEYLDILRSREKLFGIVKDELNAVKEAYATPRRTIILDAAGDMEDEDLIQREEMVVTVSHNGYIKRVPLSTYRAQRRGGKGRSGMQTREEDFVARLFVASTHTPVLFFSSLGQVYKEKVWRLPLTSPQSPGKFLRNILPLEADERITTIMPLPEDEESWATLDVFFATTGGTVRRNKLSDFTQVNRAGKIAMKLDEGEAIVDVAICTEDDDVLLTTAQGQCIRFAVPEVRVFKGRDSMGVRGIALDSEDRVISLSILRHFEANGDERTAYLKMSRAVNGEANGDTEVDVGEENGNAGAGELAQDRYAAMSAAEQFILTISENGYGKRSSSFEYRITGRGGKGIAAMAVNERNGPLVASFPVEDSDQIMLVTDGGQLIRCPVEGIRIIGRGAQGVIVFNTADDEKVVSVERVAGEDEEEGEGGEV